MSQISTDNSPDAAGAAPTTSAQSNAAESDEAVASYRVPVRRGSEYADTLLRRLQATVMQEGSGTTVIGVTSPAPRQGATTTALNLAVRAADHMIRPALVIDANLSNPEIAKLYRIKRPGFAEVLLGEKSLGDGVHETSVPGMSILGLGNRKLAKQLNLAPQAIHGFLNEVRNDFALVVVDLPACGGPLPTDSLLHHLDGIVLVARYGSATKEQLASAHRDIRDNGGKVVGLVMTGESNAMPSWLRRFF